MNKQWLKKSIGRLAAYPPVFHRLSVNKAAILMFHRVLADGDKSKPTAQTSIVIYQTEFDKLLTELKQKFTLVSLSELLSRLSEDDLHAQKPFLAITFDDGWQDNITYALPILLKHNVSAALFIANNYIATPKKFWWSALSEYFLQKDRLTTEDVQQLKNYFSLDEKQQQTISQWADNNSDLSAIDELISVLKQQDQLQLVQAGDDIVADNSATMSGDGMDWQGVSEWLAAGQEIGPHTCNHYLLTHIPLALAKQEIEQSYQDLCERFGKDKVLNVFCYPNGNNNAALQQLVKDLRFEYALGTNTGMLDRESNNFELPRFNINSSYAANPEKLALQMLKGLLKK